MASDMRRARFVPGIFIRRLFWRYRWAVLPCIVVIALNLNAHINYNTFDGYDMPQHFENTYHILTTGTMPLPPVTRDTYQAFQPPLFYILSAWVTKLGELFKVDGFLSYVPVWLLFISIIWLLLMAWFVQHAMPRAPALWRALTLCVIMLFPVNILTTTMFTNDGLANVLILIGVLILWTMVRTRREYDPALWLRAAVIGGLGILVKSSAVTFIGIYGLLAGAFTLRFLLKRQYRQFFRMTRAVAIGLCLMLIPSVIVSLHSLRYSSGAFGLAGVSEPDSMFYEANWRFLTTFDTNIFSDPFNNMGQGSYWSLLYALIHNDYYNHWHSASYERLPPAELKDVNWRSPMPIAHFEDAVRLQWLAIPVTLIILLGVAGAVVSLLRRPGRALYSGSALLLLTVVASQIGQLVFFLQYFNTLAIQARYTAFLFPLLFTWGARALWKNERQQHNLASLLVMELAGVAMIAYAFIAFRLIWLPPR